MRKAAVAFVVAMFVALAWWQTHRVTGIEAAMLAAARSGQFQGPVDGNSYTGDIECRVDRPHAYHGADIYLCKIGETGGWSEWQWGVLVAGKLHTHATDPKVIPTITGPWDAPW